VVRGEFDRADALREGGFRCFLRKREGWGEFFFGSLPCKSKFFFGWFFNLISERKGFSY